MAIVCRPTNQCTRIAKQRFYVEFGLKSRNEIRGEMGLPEIDGGDEYLLPSSLSLDENVLEETPEPEAPKTQELSYKSFPEWEKTTDAYKYAVWKSFDNISEEAYIKLDKPKAILFFS